MGITLKLGDYHRIKYPAHKNTCAVTVAVMSEHTGWSCKQACTSYTTGASFDSSSFELTLSHSQQCTRSPVTVCCVSVCVAEPGAVGPTGRDWGGMSWSYCTSHTTKFNDSHTVLCNSSCTLLKRGVIITPCLHLAIVRVLPIHQEGCYGYHLNTH